MKTKFDITESNSREHPSVRPLLSLGSEHFDRADFQDYAFAYEVEIQKSYRKILRKYSDLLYNGFTKGPTHPFHNNFGIGFDKGESKGMVYAPITDRFVKNVHVKGIQKDSIFAIFEHHPDLRAMALEDFKKRLDHFRESQKRFMFFPVLHYQLEEGTLKATSFHANLLLFESLPNNRVRAYHFEPEVRKTQMGDEMLALVPEFDDMYQTMQLIDEVKISAIETVLGELGVEYVRPQELAYKGLGPQDLHADSLHTAIFYPQASPSDLKDPFCQTHCMIWLEMVLSNPTVSPKRIVKEIFQRVKVKNYLQLVTDYIHKRKTDNGY